MAIIEGRLPQFQKGAIIKTFKMLFILFAGGFLTIWGFRMYTGEGILLRKHYKIALNSNWPPFEMHGKEPNLTAFATELLEQFGYKEKIRIDLTTLSHANLLEALKKGVYDGILIPITPDPFLKEEYAISLPIYLAGPVLIVPENSNIQDLKELKEKGIGVKTGASYIFTLGQKYNVIMVSYDNMIKALEDLENGYLAGVVMDAQLARIYTTGFYKDKLKIATSPLTAEGVRLMANRTNHGEYLIDHFNEALKQLEEEGAYGSLIKKWGLFSP